MTRRRGARRLGAWLALFVAAAAPAVGEAPPERGRTRGYLPEHDGRGIVGGSTDGTGRTARKRRNQKAAKAAKAAQPDDPA